MTKASDLDKLVSFVLPVVSDPRLGLAVSTPEEVAVLDAHQQRVREALHSIITGLAVGGQAQRGKRDKHISLVAKWAEAWQEEAGSSWSQVGRGDESMKPALLAEGTITAEQQSLSRQQVTLLVVLRGMTEALSRAKQRQLIAYASFAGLAFNHWHQSCMYAVMSAHMAIEDFASLPPPQTRAPPPLLEQCGEIVGILSVILSGVDVMRSALSSDPETGAFDHAALTQAECGMKLDTRTGTQSFDTKMFARGDENAAKERLVLFRRLLEERAARTPAERQLLSWLWGDPVLRRWVRDWATASASNVSGVHGRRGVRVWWHEEGEESAQVVDLLELREKLRVWSRSLAFLCVAAAGIVIYEMRLACPEALALPAAADGKLPTGATLRRLDISFTRRFAVWALVTAARDGLHGHSVEHEGGDTLHIRMSDLNSTLGDIDRATRPCPICEESAWDKMMMLGPCSHEMCQSCFQRHHAAYLERGAPGEGLPCPICRAVLTAWGPLEGVRGSFPFVLLGGPIVKYFMELMDSSSDAVHWSQRSTFPDGKPPGDVMLIKLTVSEASDTEGSAMSFLEDALRVERILLESVLGASLQQRRRSDGAWQCYNTMCMEFVERTQVCGGCKVARYCSRECQMQAWTDGHKRICKAYKKYRQDKAQRSTTTGDRGGTISPGPT